MIAAASSITTARNCRGEQGRLLPGSCNKSETRVTIAFCGKCLVRYDNETGKGDHRHVHGRETRSLPPCCEHGEHHDCHGCGRKPAENREPARDDEWAHDVHSYRHQYHHSHDGHGDDTVDDSAPEEDLDRIDGGEIKRY